MQNEPVTAYLNGGLGNQLFSWAAAYEISERNRTELILNISNLNNRDFGLREFNLEPYGISASELKSYQYKNILLKRLWILGNRNKHYFERTFEFCQEVLELKAGVSIHGYFQSPKYFSDTVDEIKRQLTLKNPSTEFLKYESELRNNPSLVIHVRRGDYSHANSHHKVLNEDYYRQAISNLPSDDLKTYIFTDDLEWAQEMFGPEAIFITNDELASPAENLVLMSKSDYLIGANSTFSLWAGLISDPKKGKRIFPKNWFNNTNLSTKDLIPPTFQLVDN